MADKIGRNDPCPCGSGKKYKLCCMQTSQSKGAEQRISPQFRFEPGSYAGAGRFLPSIACFKQTMPDEWDYHFVLVKALTRYEQEENAVSDAEEDLEMAFHKKERSGSDIAVAEHLRARGYVSVTGFKISRHGEEGFRESNPES